MNIVKKIVTTIALKKNMHSKHRANLLPHAPGKYLSGSGTMITAASVTRKSLAA